MNDWKEVKLGDVCDTISLTYKKCKDDVVLVNTSDIFNGKVLNHTFIKNENLRGQFKKSFQKDDILYSEIRPKNRRFAYIDFDAKNYIASTKLMVLRSNESILSCYLYQHLKSEPVLIELQAIAESRSGTFPQITFAELSNISIFLPPLPEQKAIADTLSCIDDKIELNNKINKNLEAQAQAIFKSWFIDFEPFQDGEFEDSELGRIPKGWRVGTLGEVADIQMGQSPKGTSYNEDKIGTEFYQGRTDFGFRYPKVRQYTTEPRRIANENEILLSVRAPVGDINIAGETCCIGRGLASLNSNIKCNSFLLYYLLSLQESFAVYNGEGTVFGSINKDTLSNIKIIIPKEKNIIDFQKITESIDGYIKINSKQTQTLTTLRDTLLPKLMSGEIRVPV